MIKNNLKGHFQIHRWNWGQELKAGTWKQELKQRPWKNLDYCLVPRGLLSLLSHIIQYHTPRDGTTQRQSSIKKIYNSLVHKPVLCMCFLNWVFLFPNDSNLCQVDITLISILCILGWTRTYYIAQAGFEFRIFLLQAPKFWYIGRVISCPTQGFSLESFLLFILIGRVYFSISMAFFPP